MRYNPVAFDAEAAKIQEQAFYQELQNTKDVAAKTIYRPGSAAGPFVVCLKLFSSIIHRFRNRTEVVSFCIAAVDLLVASLCQVPRRVTVNAMR